MFPACASDDGHQIWVLKVFRFPTIEVKMLSNNLVSLIKSTAGNTQICSS
jgi:hypothetical protein